MVVKFCKICSKKFFVKPSREKTAKFCSWKCRKNKIIKKCLNCRKEFLVQPYRKNTANYCSYKCHKISKKGKHYSLKTEIKKGQIGNKSLSWKGGKYQRYDNRWLIYKPNHPFTTRNRYLRRSRLIAEKYLGRYLTPKEIIHHINEIVDDDQPENLYLFSNNIKHLIFHRLKNKSILISNL